MLARHSFSSLSDKNQLTGAVNDGGARPAALLNHALDLFRIQHACDFMDDRTRPDCLVLSRHLRTEAGSGVAGSEIRAVHAGLESDHIVVGRASAEG